MKYTILLSSFIITHAASAYTGICVEHSKDHDHGLISSKVIFNDASGAIENEKSIQISEKEEKDFSMKDYVILVTKDNNLLVTPIFESDRPLIRASHFLLCEAK